MKPCPKCGKSSEKFLSLTEALDLGLYTRTHCIECLLTEVLRPKADDDASPVGDEHEEPVPCDPPPDPPDAT